MLFLVSVATATAIQTSPTVYFANRFEEGDAFNPNQGFQGTLLGSCGCAGVALFPNEVFAMEGDYGCIGGCDGGEFVHHTEGTIVKTIDMWWGGGVPNEGVAKMCVTNGNATAWCEGQEKGTKCSYTFSENEKLIDMTLYGNGIGTRFGRLEFNTILPNGETHNWSCGPSAGRNPYRVTNANGKQISGFFGRAGADINMLGVLLIEPTCTVISKKITNMECINKSGMNCLADWVDGGHYITLEQGCDACNTSAGIHCGLNFNLKETHSIEMTSTSSQSIDVNTGVSMTATAGFNVEVVKAEVAVTTSVNVGYGKTWGTTKSQTTSTETTVGSDCSADLLPHTMVYGRGNAKAGSMVADMRITVTEVDSCGNESPTEHTYQLTVSNVAMTAEIAHCTYEDGTCPGQPTLPPSATPAPIPSPSGDCANGPYDACGGQNPGDGWSGETCCPDGFTCEVKSVWYSQCEPAMLGGVDPVAAPSCVQHGVVFKGKPTKFEAADAAECYQLCQTEVTSKGKKCKGWSWKEGSQKPCRLYARRNIVATKEKSGFLSGLRGCNPQSQ